MKRSMILITLMLMCFNATTYAQSDNVASEIVSDYDFSTFTINGLVMAECEYSEQDIITAFGEPDSVEYGEFGYSYNYKCGEVYSSDKGDYARVCDYDAIIVLSGKPKGQILTAYVYDDKYIVNGYVRVGDDKSKIYEMEGDKEEICYDNNGGAIFWRPTGWKDIEFTNCPKFTYDARGVITSIGFWSF